MVKLSWPFRVRYDRIDDNLTILYHTLPLFAAILRYHKGEKTPIKGGAGWRRNVLSAHCSGVLPLAKLLHNVTWSFRKAETPL
ncbi:MAG: hypothetical protein LBG26_07290, partial [Treponema sp.]|nr:hypothetical protein [Treponema sp.]